MNTENQVTNQENNNTNRPLLILNQNTGNPSQENPVQMPSPIQMPPGAPAIGSQPYVLVLNKNLNLPFDVETDLSQFTQVYVTKDFDFFRSRCCFEPGNTDYIVYGLLPDGDKKVLFTSRKHFQFCHCCEDCSIGCLCCDYLCCDRIIFQMDYKRNGAPFYTQGVNIQKGCYCCKCHCACCLCCDCCCNCPKSILFLRENVEPDNKDFNVGKRKGQTIYSACCGCCSDSVVEYSNQEGIKGHSIRLACCETFKQACKFIALLPCFGLCLCSLLCCNDIEIAIESPNGLKNGNIIVPNGIFSERKEINSCCFCPNHHYEINFPGGITSAEKFQIIAETIHLDLQLGLL